MTGSTAGRGPCVVVGVDGSRAAGAALDFAIGEARLRGATLVAVMAVEIPDYAWIDPYATRSHPADDVLERAHRKLDEILAAAGTEGVPVDPVVTAMPAPAALIDRSGPGDLLVVGSRGHGGFRGLVMGSVSMQCVLHARCPVTVVHSTPEPAADLRHHTLEDARRETTTPFF